MTWTDQIVVPVGLITPLLRIDYVRAAVQQMSLALMRRGPRRGSDVGIVVSSRVEPTS